MPFAAAPRRGAPYVFSAAVALLALTTAACDVQVGDKGVSFDIASGKATEEWVRTYTLSPGGLLDITDLNGTIHVQPSAGPTIEVRAHREAKAGSDEAARQLLADSKIVDEVAPDHVKVEVQRPANNAGGFRRSLSVEYDVRIPRGLKVSLRTQNGSVRLTDVSGTITAGTTNGGIIADNVAGAFSASTVNGGVQLSFADITGDVDAHTVNGGVRIELPSDANAQLDASVVNGGVNVDDALKLANVDRDPRHVSGTLNRGGHRISAQTTNGGVRISRSSRGGGGQGR